MTAHTMTRKELVAAIAEKSEISKAAAERAVKAMLDTITETLAEGGSVALVGFGTFGVTERPARKGRNPSTGAEIEIPASRKPFMKAGQTLKSAVNS